MTRPQPLRSPLTAAADVALLARETVFQGHFRVDRYRLRFRRFDGGWSDPCSREIFERGHAAACLLYDPDRDAVVLIEQFRPGAFAAGDPNPWVIEIVAGIIDAGEAPDAVARREVEEEAGCRPGRIEPILRCYASQGGSTETVALFIAEIDSRQAAGTHGLAHEHEDIRVLVLPVAEALAALDAGQITHSMAIITLQWLALHKAALLRRWRP